MPPASCPGSLYHHFDSKESIVDELLDSFQRSLWEEYDAIEASDRTPREKLEAVVRASFDAIDHNHSEVAIFQTDAAYLASFDRFAYLEERNIRFRNLWTGLLTQGVASGELRSDLNVELVYRFLRDTVWVAVRWYRPGGDLSPAQVADQYLHILLDGISERTPTCLRPTSSTPSGPRSASAAAHSPRCTRPTSAPTCSRRWSNAPASTPVPSTTS